jgi:hypothetical protein
MSNIRRFVVLGAMLAAGGIALPAQAATGHLICRGSDDSTVNLTSIDNAAGDVAVSWGFEKYAGTASSIKANGGHLSPGQCSWDNGAIAARYIPNVTYFVDPSQIWMIITMRDDISTAGADNNGWFAYGRRTTDKNLMWLPTSTVSNHNKGSIFDPAMIFHFYVNISASNELSLYKTTWAAFPYPGR